MSRLRVEKHLQVSQALGTREWRGTVLFLGVREPRPLGSIWPAGPVAFRGVGVAPGQCSLWPYMTITFYGRELVQLECGRGLTELEKDPGGFHGVLCKIRWWGHSTGPVSGKGPRVTNSDRSGLCSGRSVKCQGLAVCTRPDGVSIATAGGRCCPPGFVEGETTGERFSDPPTEAKMGNMKGVPSLTRA